MADISKITIRLPVWRLMLFRLCIVVVAPLFRCGALPDRWIDPWSEMMARWVARGLRAG